MANPNESEHDRQFREDLEKATALSMETLALDQFRRNKLYRSDSTSEQHSNPLYGSTSKPYRRPDSYDQSQTNFLQNSASTGSLAQAPAVPPRRHSESRESLYQSKHKDEPDLINFSNTSDDLTTSGPNQPPANDPHSNFKKFVDDMHKLNATYQAQPFGFGFKPNSFTPNNAAGMQIVPYTQPESTVNQKIPLTPEQLDNLYKMNYAVQPYAGIGNPNVYSYNMQRPVAPPPVFYPGNNSPVMFPSNPSSLQQQQQLPQQSIESINAANYNRSMAGTSFNSTSNASQQYFNQNVINPQTALVHVPKLPPKQNSSLVNPYTLPKTDSVSHRNKRLGDDLIDLDIGSDNNSRVSVLEAFDPLMAQNDDQGENVSDCTTSYYSEYDPFDYLYSGGTQYSDPVYEAVNKIDRTPVSPAPPPGWNIPPSTSELPVRPPGWFIPQSSNDLSVRPPPLPPRNSQSSPTTTIIPPTVVDSLPKQEQSQFQSLDRRKVSTKLYENVIIRKKYDPELVAFYHMAKTLRQHYKYNDSTTNLGYVTAAEFNNLCTEGTSIKLLVHPALECLTADTANNRLSRSNSETSSLNNGKGQHLGYGPPVPFTCDISTTVEHVKLQAFCRLEGIIAGTANDYILKPIGMSEWLSPQSKLSQLECVHDSLKLEMDVQLGLTPISYAQINSIGRTSQDDIRDAELKIEDILAHEPVDTINYDNLMILLETLEDEIVKLELSASDPNPRTILSCSGVTQAVKMICALLGSLDTLSLTDVIDDLKSVCASGQTIYTYGDYSSSKLNILSETGDYAEVSLRPKTTAEQITHRCNNIRSSIQNLLETYCNAFRVDFCVNTPEFVPNLISITKVSEPVMVHLMCLHRPPPNWKHDDYMLGAQIYYGTKYIGDAVVSQCSNEISGIFPRLKFNSWLHFEGLPICTLPREARLIFVLYGCTTEPAENENSNDQGGDRKVTKIELGWSSIQFFDFERKMIQGTYLLSLWPPTTDKFLGPAPAIGTHPHGYHCPVLSIEIPHYGGQIMFPEAPKSYHTAARLDFNSLDRNLQQELMDTAQQGYSCALSDKREVLWEKRYYLQSFPYALPKVLHASQVHDFASLIELHSLIESWDDLSPLQALELLLPRYPDMQIRYHAVRWISAMSNDQLVDFLPQLLQALKHDTYDGSPMAEFLLRRSLESPRIAHHLYWLLVHSLPGDSPQNSIDLDIDETSINQARYNRRNQMLLRALLAICGEKLSARFLAQNMMCRSLAEVALSVKQTKESLRQKTLVQGLEIVNQLLLERPTTLPLGPGLEVTGINARSCTYFNSNTLPLKINFYGPDKILLPAIFKAGDDLQQDMLTIQLVRVMDKLWLQEGLDLKMVTFNCVPTGLKKGMIEMITDAETLRKIQVEWGLTGSFKDKPIAEWLARQNPSQLEYQRAVDNFTVSCAGYSVVTYILGICDRHNDNIMLKSSGHLFHIDFGKFLGDAQMFGNFKRDRTPFVLTSDMAYVINGGDRPSTKFHHFVDLCCKAFNIVRRHGDLILHMLALMATSGITGVNADAVNYVRNALLPGQSNPEAAASFAKMIHISLKSWFTQFNFFLHNLAQLRFSGDDGNGELLSFVPRTYTMAQDGRLKSVMVHGFQKRYDLEKYYTFILIVTRQNQPDPAYLFRSYKEFTEFHQKLCVHYPLAKLHSLPSGNLVGRSNIKTVAERRLPEIRLFLTSLFRSADEIAHSDLVYTFFHPLLRDQQEQDIHVAKVKEPKPNSSTERVCGEIKLSLQYHRGALTVMVHHARSLPTSLNGQEPNTYVKVYLKPDPTKATKRKTKVVRKNCFPSFMETLEYRMPIEFIQCKTLQVTIWSHDSLQENEFYGGVELELSTVDLKEELVSWFPLSYLSRS